MRVRGAQHKVRDGVVSAGRWLAWRPWRLGVLVLVLLGVWVVSASLRQDESGPAAPEPSTTVPGGVEMPEGWQSWPSVTATHHPQGSK